MTPLRIGKYVILGSVVAKESESRFFRNRNGHSSNRDARTLTWDRNPKPDRSDPKYFPVNSLPRQNHSHHRGGAQPGGGGGGGGADHPVDPGAPGGPPPLVDGYPGGPRPPDGGGDPMMGPHPPPRGLGGAGGGDPGMPPPMRELSTGRSN